MNFSESTTPAFTTHFCWSYLVVSEMVIEVLEGVHPLMVLSWVPLDIPGCIYYRIPRLLHLCYLWRNDNLFLPESDYRFSLCLQSLESLESLSVPERCSSYTNHLRQRLCHFTDLLENRLHSSVMIGGMSLAETCL